MNKKVQSSTLKKLIEAKSLRKTIAQRRDPNGLSYEAWNPQQTKSN